MIIFHLNNTRTSILKDVTRQLRAGAVVIYPTDTAYAIGCDATNAKAVARIFTIKGRAASKALPIICADLKMAKKFFLLTTHYSLLTKKHWPGPLSIIVKAKQHIARKLLSKGTAAIRVPDSKIARDLSHLLGRPLVATSANRSGMPACYSVRGVLAQFRRQPSPGLRPPSPVLGRGFVVLDAGALPRRKPSTIIRVPKSGIIEVLRKGPVNILRAKR